MPSYLTNPANSNYDFGQAFNYAVWTEGTNVTLTNVPWNNDYRDICQFPTASGQTLDQYIDGNAHSNDTVNNVSYIKFNVPVRLNIPFNAAFKFNYLRVQNPLQPIPGSDVLKSYYYFILDVKYLAPNATEFTIQLDIFQSFRNDFKFGNSYIERGHIGIANTKAFDNYGRDYLTIPEGIDFGSEYQIIERTHTTLIGRHNASEFYTEPNVMIVSTIDLDADPGTVTAPILVTAQGSQYSNIASGASVYIFQTLSDFVTWTQANRTKPWVTQGIISITIVPDLNRYYPDVTPNFWQSIYNNNSSGSKINGKAYPIGSFYPMAKTNIAYVNWRNSSTIISHIPARYQHLRKLFTSPYMVIEMTTWTGTPIILKPESWNDPDATFIERINVIAPNQRIVGQPLRYNAITNSVVEEGSSGETNGGDDGGDYLDLTSIIANFPTMAIVNNGALNYLASNFANIAYGRQSADWTQSRALRGNETTYDQTNRGIQTSKGINALQNAGVQAQAANQNLLIANNQAVTGIGGVISATASAFLGMNEGSIGLGGIATAVGKQVMGSITTGNQEAANSQGANITQSVSRGSNAAQNLQTGYVNDTNKSLADWAARGDYENSIAGINAQVAGASMVQPTSSGQQAGETFNLSTGSTFEFSLRWKLIDKSAMSIVCEYWLRYGYAVRRFAIIPTNLMVMSKFTYWKLLETYIISSSMPEGFKQIIRGIFEKGVTVWADPSYIGNTDLADNQPLGGITL